MGLSLAGPSFVGLGLLTLWWCACVDPVTDASSFPCRPSFDGESVGAPGLFRLDADTAPLESEEDATPGSCACARVPGFFAGSGRPASRARFGSPQLFLWPFLVRSLSARPPACGCSCVFFFAPPLSLAFCVFPPGVPWALASCAPPPLLVFFSLLPPCVFLPVFVFFFSFFFFFFAVVCWLCVALCWCVAGCRACLCVLFRALCFGGGCCALALRRSVLSSFFVECS